MKKVCQVTYCLVVLLLPQFFCKLYAQNFVQRGDTKTTLQLGSAFYTVVSYASVLLDSSLLVYSRSLHLSRIKVITEGIDEDYCLEHCQWMDNGKVGIVKKELINLKGIDHTRMLLLIGAYYAFQPGPANYNIAIKYLLLAKSEAEKARNLSWSAHAAILIGKSYFMLNNTAMGRQWFDKVTSDNALKSFPEIQAKAWNYQGMFCPFQPQLSNFRLECLQNALITYKQLKDTGNQINTLMNVAYLSFASTKVQEAEQAALKSLALQKSIHFKSTQYTDDLLAFLKSIKADFSGQLYYALESINQVEATGDQLALPHAQYRLAMCYVSMENVSEAQKWIKLALKSMAKSGGGTKLYILLQDVSRNNSQIPVDKDMGRVIKSVIKHFPPRNDAEAQNAYMALGIVYSEQKNSKTALNYFLRAKKFEDDPNFMGGMKNTYLIILIGVEYFNAKDFVKSKAYLLNFISGSSQFKQNTGQLLDAYYLLNKIESAFGNYKLATQYLEQFITLNKIFNNEKTSKQFSSLSVKYQTLQRQKRLELLQAQNALQIEKEATTRKISAGGFLVLVLIIVMIYIRYRSNQKKNSLLALQKDEIDKKNLALQSSNDKQTVLLSEKEWLLREIHHRVKNNLQVVISLLNSQSVYLKDEIALSAMTESQHRVQAMSLIHQKLYNSENISNIYMPEYIGDLVEYLKDSFETKQRVFFDLQIAKIRLDIAHAVALGLILNEIITNAFKYAFPHTDYDKVTIKLICEEDDQVTLLVADNGRGLPENFDLQNHNSFGMILMRGMAEDLEGTFSITNNNGTQISVTFTNSSLTNHKVQQPPSLSVH